MDVENVSALIPILPGHERALRLAVEALPGRDRSPFARVPGTHVARLVVLDSFGGPATPRRRLHPALLALSAMIDGPFDPWLDSMCTALGPNGDSLWRHCAGWPGLGPTVTARWLYGFRIRKMHTSIVGNPSALRPDVEKGLRQRAALLELALAGRLPPDELRRRYDTTVRP